MAVKRAFQETSSNALASWSDETDPCSSEWQARITCNENGRIVSLNLASELLKGPIPGKQLAELDALERL